MATLEALYRLVATPVTFFLPPKLRTRILSLSYPHPMLVFAFALGSYFLVISGFVFDVINEPPGIGYKQDAATGRWVPSVILEGRLNQQYIIEGLSAGFMFVLGGIGIILVDLGCDKNKGRNSRLTLLGVGVGLVVLTYIMSMVFLKIKMPGYMH